MERRAYSVERTGREIKGQKVRGKSRTEESKMGGNRGWVLRIFIKVKASPRKIQFLSRIAENFRRKAEMLINSWGAAHAIYVEGDKSVYAPDGLYLAAGWA